MSSNPPGSAFTPHSSSLLLLSHLLMQLEVVNTQDGHHKTRGHHTLQEPKFVKKMSHTSNADRSPFQACLLEIISPNVMQERDKIRRDSMRSRIWFLVLQGTGSFGNPRQGPGSSLKEKHLHVLPSDPRTRHPRAQNALHTCLLRRGNATIIRAAASPALSPPEATSPASSHLSAAHLAPCAKIHPRPCVSSEAQHTDDIACIHTCDTQHMHTQRAHTQTQCTYAHRHANTTHLPSRHTHNQCTDSKHIQTQHTCVHCVQKTQTQNTYGHNTHIYKRYKTNTDMHTIYIQKRHLDTTHINIDTHTTHT